MKNVIIASLVLFCMSIHAQELPEVTLNVEKALLQGVLHQMEEQTGYQFFYHYRWVDSVYVSVSLRDVPLGDALNQTFSGTNLKFFIENEQVFITKDIEILLKPKISELLFADSSMVQTNVESGLVFLREYQIADDGAELNKKIFEIGSRSEMKAGGTAAIAGYVKHQENGEPLPSVLVYTDPPVVSVLSDESGFYSINLPVGKHTLHYQLIGMKPAQRNVVLFANGQLDVDLFADVRSLDEVIIESAREANIQDVRMGVSSIKVQDTKNVPLVLGERDVMKVATTFAGVQTVGEGASGFNVRGGKADQNLITLDNVPIYNTSHFFGFFSVFNSAAINDLQIYKSSIPARYGGRLSSVMDIASKKANRDSLSGTGGISTITSNLTLEVPLFKGHAGLTVSGRTTYSNWMLKRVGNSEFRENRVSFSDALLRYDHDIGSNTHLTLTGYYSADNFRMNSDTLFSFSDFKYQNQATSLTFIHHLARDLAISFSANYTDYSYDLTNSANPRSAFLQDFGIAEMAFKSEINHSKLDLHDITAGVEVKQIDVNPGSQSPFNAESLVSDFRIQQELGIESAAYLADKYAVSDALSFSLGLRYSVFNLLGAHTAYTYSPNSPKNADTRADSLVYDDGEVVETYHGLEPRLSARLKIDNRSSIKVGYNRTRQYIHTLTNSASVSPTDIWRLSSPHLKPQIADQLSIGYYRNFARSTIETSLEVYYKDLQNLLDFKVGSNFLLNPFVETVTLQGPGRSYGIEVSVEKSGRLSGWINYTFARTFIKLDSPHGEERINEGAYYPANYDIPHALNLVTNYKLTHRVSLSYNFIYKSGRPITYPTGVYDFHNSLSIHYSDRNAFRIPHYLRMDLGINLEAGHRKNKLAYSYWTFSVYNLTGRANPFSVFFSVSPKEIQGHKLVVFGSPIPTITYNFKF